MLLGEKPFLPEDIHIYLNKENPFYYNAIAQEYVIKTNEQYHQGAFDFQFDINANEKNYPLSTGNYEEVKITKSIENGIEFSVGYRQAKGVQEYNNIKTGANGEFISMVKVPLLSVIQDISKNKVNLEKAKIDTKKQHQISKQNLLLLYLHIKKVYYQLLFQHEILKTEQHLLQKAEKNFIFVSKQVKIGVLPKISLFDIESQIIERKQRLLSAKNLFTQVENIFLKFLGISKKEFYQHYTLPPLTIENRSNLSLQEALNIAIKNHPILKQLEHNIEKNRLEKEYNELSKYPKINIGFYKIYDNIYKEGHKVTFDLNMPIERNRYKGKREYLKRDYMLIHNKQEELLREIKATIKNLLHGISTIKNSITMSKKEIVLAKKLERVENKKYQQGLSQLILINQREIQTLQVEQKLLKYYYDLQILYTNLEFQLGEKEPTLDL